MFAIAARYDQTEAPPLDPGNLWEAGLDYMVQAREVLSMPFFVHFSGLKIYLQWTRPCLPLLQGNDVPSLIAFRLAGVWHWCITPHVTVIHRY